MPDRKAQGPQLTHSMPYVPHAFRDQVDRIKRPADTAHKQILGLGFGFGLASTVCLWLPQSSCNTMQEFKVLVACLNHTPYTVHLKFHRGGFECHAAICFGFRSPPFWTLTSLVSLVHMPQCHPCVSYLGPQWCVLLCHCCPSC